MGWLRLVGSLKLQVPCAEYSLFYRALLQKRPIILRSLLIVATPYTTFGLRDTPARHSDSHLSRPSANAWRVLDSHIQAQCVLVCVL